MGVHSKIASLNHDVWSALEHSRGREECRWRIAFFIRRIWNLHVQFIGVDNIVCSLDCSTGTICPKNELVPKGVVGGCNTLHILDILLQSLENTSHLAVLL